ncbi:MAG TPA: diguanylate cyclase, partial [Terriglobales bacterium]
FGMVTAMHWVPPSSPQLGKVGLLMFTVSAVGLIVGAAVSERHRIADDLLERTTYLNSLIQNSPLGIVVLDRNGGIELCNEAFGRLFDLPHDGLAGKLLRDIFPASDNEVPQLPELLSPEKTEQHSVRRSRRDGKILNLELHVVPVFGYGSSHGAYTIYQDITEQVRSAEAERKHADSLQSLVAELEVHTWQMTMLNEMGRLLECCATTGEASSVVGNCLQKLFPDALSGVLYLFRSSRNAVELASQWGTGTTSETIFSPDHCWALRRGQPHWSNSRDEGISCSHLSQPREASCLCLPLVGQGETLGVLHLGWSDAAPLNVEGSPDSSRIARQTLGTTVAAQIALSLANLRLRETLRDQSIRDPLTGLFNRRFMHESLERELQRARRKNHSLAILLVDLDHFKRFNDSFGHDAGDFVLRSLAETFRSFFRSDDIVCRHGGEEFAFLLPESSAADAVRRANELRNEVKRLKLEYAEHLLGKITLSVGVVAFPDHGVAAEDLLKLADHCLYQSKAAGRDRVTAASAPLHADVPQT